MRRFDHFNPKPDDFITPEQQAANFRAANVKTRAPRPYQKPPTVRSQGHKRKHVQDANLPLDDDQLADEQTGDSNSSKWGERMRKRGQAWSEQREGNRQSAVQYRALFSEGIELLQLAAAEHCTVTALCKAVLLHPCLLALEADELTAAVESSLLVQLMALLPGERARPAPDDGQQQQQQHGPPPQQHQHHHQQQHGPPPQEHHQQQQQQQQQQPQPQPILQVVATRLVACHTLGASFWLPVPTVRCSCCNDEWEQQPAAAGFFGSTPKQPWSWFSQQLLDFYTPLCTAGGCSITNMAAALERVHVKVDDTGLKIDPR
jgi:hypothetical protein